MWYALLPPSQINSIYSVKTWLSVCDGQCGTGVVLPLRRHMKDMSRFLWSPAISNTNCTCPWWEGNWCCELLFGWQNGSHQFQDTVEAIFPWFPNFCSCAHDDHVLYKMPDGQYTSKLKLVHLNRNQLFFLSSMHSNSWRRVSRVKDVCNPLETGPGHGVERNPLCSSVTFFIFQFFLMSMPYFVVLSSERKKMRRQSTTMRLVFAHIIVFCILMIAEGIIQTSTVNKQHSYGSLSDYALLLWFKISQIGFIKQTKVKFFDWLWTMLFSPILEG